MTALRLSPSHETGFGIISVLEYGCKVNPLGAGAGLLRDAVLVVRKVFFRTFNFPLLRSLVSPEQEKNDHLAKPGKIDPITRPSIYPQPRPRRRFPMNRTESAFQICRYAGVGTRARDAVFVRFDVRELKAAPPLRREP